MVLAAVLAGPRRKRTVIGPEQTSQRAIMDSRCLAPPGLVVTLAGSDSRRFTASH